MTPLILIHLFSLVIKCTNLKLKQQVTLQSPVVMKSTTGLSI